MVMTVTSLNLHLLPLFLLLLPVTINGDSTFNITNRCPYTVWPAAWPVGGGRQLDPGESWILNMLAGTKGGRVWPRTGCSFKGGRNGSCQTGDCGGMLSCKISGQPPITTAEFTLGVGNTTDYFDISLVDGFNVPMDFLPMPTNIQQGVQGCSRGPRCAANITSQCPKDLKAPGGCNSACTVFEDKDKYCCIGNSNNTCEPTTYSLVFVRMCPDAYSYSRDDSSSTTFTCPSGTNYQVVFCPSNDISASPPATNPHAPTGTGSLSFTRSRVLSVVLGSIGILVVLVVFITFFAYKLRKQRHQEMQEEDEEFGELPGMPTRFTFQQLQEATDQFKCKLGEGGFGSVFEGQYGEERIAVKRLDRAGQGKREFLAEVQTIGSIHHIHLVRLIGFCAEKLHRLLVYEYMPKGSLDRWIFNSHDNDAPSLDWQTRRKVITHIA
ncbi:zeamatin [Setaria italica]|uniref:zeamatin n=1 Tax=Setaria italica TaxID=4555 RepID=UPI000BE4E5B0|nr:zeamatin [Setaria italica]